MAEPDWQTHCPSISLILWATFDLKGCSEPPTCVYLKLEDAATGCSLDCIISQGSPLLLQAVDLTALLLPATTQQTMCQPARSPGKTQDQPVPHTPSHADWQILFHLFFGNYKFVLCISLFVIPWTAACQSPLSMGFSRQDYWSGLPFPSPGYLPNPGSKHRSPTLQADSLLSEISGKPILFFTFPI